MFTLLKLIPNFFSGEPKRPLVPKVKPARNIKKLFLRLSEENCYQHQKYITFLIVPLLNSTNLHFEMLFRIHYTHTFLYHYFLLY